MERQTRVFPLIFDMDLKVTSTSLLSKVPEGLKKGRPWRGRVDFSLWHGADHFVLGQAHFCMPVISSHIYSTLYMM